LHYSEGIAYRRKLGHGDADRPESESLAEVRIRLTSARPDDYAMLREQEQESVNWSSSRYRHLLKRAGRESATDKGRAGGVGRGGLQPETEGVHHCAYQGPAREDLNR
jgi:hypothetical protein